MTCLPVYAHLNWTIHELEPVAGTEAPRLMGVAEGNGKFVAAGLGGEIFVASDPENWGLAEVISDAQFHGVAFGGGLFVAVGRDPVAEQALVAISEDGEEWNLMRLDTKQRLLDVAFGNGRFVAVGDLIVARAEKGGDWTFDLSFERTWEPVHSDVFNSIIFVNGQFVATLFRSEDWENGLHADVGGFFLLSEDGMAWEEYGPQPGVWAIPGVAFGRGKYIALGGSDVVAGPHFGFVSLDGREWVREYPQWEGAATAIAYGNGMFVIATLTEAAEENPGFGGKVFVSVDGSNWKESLLLENRRLASVTFAANRFIGVGSGIIAVSEQVEFQPIVTNAKVVELGVVEFDVDAPDGATWEVEVSSDLREWMPAGVIEGNSAGFQTFRTSLDLDEAKFFRVKKR